MIPATNYLTSIFLVALLTACAMGPDFKKPAPPQVDSYTNDTTIGIAHDTSFSNSLEQHFLKGEDIPGNWWALFHSQPLNDLIELALKNNPTIAAAQAALRVAHENVLTQKAAFFPSVSGSFSSTRQKTSDEISPTPNSGALTYNLLTPQVSVFYVPDVFGLTRRTVESFQAQAEAQRYQLAATYITLIANLVNAAIQEAALRKQISTTQQLIGLNAQMVEMLKRQFAKGYASGLDVATQESQLAQISVTLPPLLKQLAQQRDFLTALAGGFPDKDLPEKFELDSLHLPPDLPLSLPSRLVYQRPDVCQAEENLHAASAEIGIAMANRFPNITLSASAGFMALDPSDIFSPNTGFWGLTGAVTQSIFQGGALMHAERASRAAYVEAAEQYRGTVITAFQNVADALTALKIDADALKAALAAKEATETVFNVTMRQVQAGGTGKMALLNAEQSYQQAMINLVQVQATRFIDTGALFFALGGGWWNRADLTKN